MITIFGLALIFGSTTIGIFKLIMEALPDEDPPVYDPTPLLTGNHQDDRPQLVGTPDDRIQAQDDRTTTLLTSEPVPVTFTWNDLEPNLINYPALALIGPQGSGKTTIAQHLIRVKKQAGHTIAVLDPHYRKGEWEGCQIIGAGKNYAAINAYLKEVASLVNDRYRQREAEGTEKFPPLTIVVEELTCWEGKVSHAQEFVKSALSDFRKIGLKALFISHGETNALWGGANGTRGLRDSSLAFIRPQVQLTPEGAKPLGKAQICLPGMDAIVVTLPNLAPVHTPSSPENSPAPAPVHTPSSPENSPAHAPVHLASSQENSPAPAPVHLASSQENSPAPAPVHLASSQENSPFEDPRKIQELRHLILLNYSKTEALREVFGIDAKRDRSGNPNSKYQKASRLFETLRNECEQALTLEYRQQLEIQINGD
jgi:energy-coupling factor transporter ATP-binding protein EcfA2